MSDTYEPFLIPVEVIGGKDAESTLKNIDSKLKEISENLIDVGYGADAMKILTANMRDLSSVSKTVASGISSLNKANAQAAKDAESVALAHQKVVTEAGKTARELEKAKTQAASTAVANQKLSTEMEKTAVAHARAEMAALRVAQAHEKQALKAQQAARPYNQLNQQLREQAQKLQDAIVKGNLNDFTLGKMADKYKRLQSELQNATTKFNTLTGAVKKTDDSLTKADIALASFLGNLGSDLLQRGIQGFIEFARGVSSAGIALDGIRNTFAAGARGWKEGGEEMAFVAEMADKLGLNLQATYEPYAKFMTSFTRSGGTIAQSRQIFEDLSTAMVSLHLPASKMEGVFVALEQMANKGTVQAEELKRQLSNALPAAFELAAQSMDILPSQLMDLMKKGQVFSKDFLPKFAATVKESLGKQIGIAVDQFNAHMNRLQSQTWILQANLGQAFNLAITPIVKFTGEALKQFNLLTGGFLQGAKGATVLQASFVALGAAMLPSIAKFTAVSKVVRILSLDIVTLTRYMRYLVTTTGLLQTMGLVAVFTAIAGAVMYCTNSINEINQKFSEQTVQLLDVNNHVVGLLNEYSSLSQITNKNTAQQEAYNRVLGTLKDEYPELLNYIETHGVNLKTVTREQAENIASMAIAAKMQEAESIRIEKLTNKWLIFGARAKQAAGAFLLGCQMMEVGVAHVGIAIAQTFTRAWAIALKVTSEATEKIAWAASKLGQKDLAVQFDNATKALKGFASTSWDFGKQAHANLNGALKTYAQGVLDIETQRVEKANKEFKNTLASLGSEQQKIVDSIMSASATSIGLQTGGTGIDKKGRTNKSKTQTEDAWTKLNKQANETLELIRVNKLLGKDTKELEKTYVGYKTQIDEVEKAISKLNEKEKQINYTAAEQAIKAWEDKKKALQNAEKQYKGMVLAGNNYTQSQLDQQKAIMKTLKAENAYYERLENREDLMKISTRSAQQLSNELIDSIFEPLKEGETLWDRFKDAGISALKSIAAAWTKSFMQDIATGFQSGFITGQGGFLSKIVNGFSGIQTLLQGKALNSGLGVTNASSSTNALSSTTQQAQSLAQTLQSQTVPAVANTVNAISGVQNPALLAAQGVANMAVSAPIAATGMGALSATMMVASTAFTSAAPALVKMAGAMASLAASAGTAATSMAALAVATAAQSVAQIPLVGGFLAPVAALATGAAVAAGTALTGAAIGAGAMMAGGGQMLGGAMAGIGNKLSGVSGLQKGTSVVPHAKGGIVSSPTMFPMQGGNIGLAGEAGTEVIAPARRMSNGDVGIGAVQPQVIVNNYTNAAVEVKKRPDNSMEIKIAELNTMLSSSRTNKGMSNAQSRLQKNGMQIG